MKFFLILLIVSTVAFAGKVSVVATVNHTPITTFDIKDRIEILQEIIPNFTEYSTEEKQVFALQHLMQSALKQEYVKRVAFSITEEEMKEYRRIFIKILHTMKVQNADTFVKRYPNFIHDEALWQAVVEKTIKPSINVTDEMLSAVHAQKPEISKDKIHNLLIDQQVQSQTSQLLESMKNISVIEIKR